MCQSAIFATSHKSIQTFPENPKFKKRYYHFRAEVVYFAFTSGATVLEYGDTVCLVGGYDSQQRVVRRSVHCWNPLAMTAAPSSSGARPSGWVALPEMQHGRFRHVASCLNLAPSTKENYLIGHCSLPRAVVIFAILLKKTTPHTRNLAQ